MKQLKSVSLIFLLFTLVSCGMNIRTIYDQEIMNAVHDPAKDMLLDQQAQSAMFVPDQKEPKLTTAVLAGIVSKEYAGLTAYKLNMLYDSDFTKKSAQKGLSGKLTAARTNFNNQALDGIIDIGKRLSLKYIIIPEVIQTSEEEAPAQVQLDADHYDGDYYWPAVYATDMKITGNASITTHVIHIADPAANEQLQTSHTVEEYYDTPQTYQAKINIISHENRMRSIENSRREAIEREKAAKEEAERKKKGDKTDIFDVLDAVLTSYDAYNLPMLEIPRFHKPVMADRKLLYTELYSKNMAQSYTQYMTRYDGLTVSGDTINGQGEFKFLNGDSCSGNWLDASINGRGEYKRNDGESHIGMFVKGIPNGYGRYTRSGNYVYDGYYKNGYKHGSGMLYVFSTSGIDYHGEIFIGNGGKVVKGSEAGSPSEFLAFKKIKQDSIYKVTAKKGLYTQMIIQDVKFEVPPFNPAAYPGSM